MTTPSTCPLCGKWFDEIEDSIEDVREHIAECEENE